MKKRGLNPELINDPNEILVDQVHLDNRVYYCRCALSVSSILMLRFVLSRSFQSFINAILLFYLVFKYFIISSFSPYPFIAISLFFSLHTHKGVGSQFTHNLSFVALSLSSPVISLFVTSRQQSIPLYYLLYRVHPLVTLHTDIAWTRLWILQIGEENLMKPLLSASLLRHPVYTWNLSVWRALNSAT